jgi:CBS domain-containing protein
MPDNTIINSIPFDLNQEIESARSVDQLRDIDLRMPEMVRGAIKAGSGTRNVVQIISCFNDAVTRRLIAILESAEGISLPEGATFLVLGSEGRGEQTLRTDQDNAIVYHDDLPASELGRVNQFAARLVDALDEIGVPRCPGGIMASTPDWCHSVSEWKQLVNQWTTVPTPAHILRFGMFQDLRSLHGDENLVMQLRDHICCAVQSHSLFLPNMACHVVRFPSPFTIFGRIRTEHSKEHYGLIDLKKAGIFAITTGASLLALEAGIIGGDTWNKLELLGNAGVFSSGDCETIVKAFTFLVQLRLQHQLRELADGSKPSNYVDPRLMTDKEQEQFRQALHGVNTFLWIFREHYLLDYISM